MAAWFYHQGWVVPKSSVEHMITLFGLTFEFSVFATGLHPSSAYVDTKKIHYVLVPVVPSSSSPARNHNTDLGREGGDVLSLITVWVDVTSYKSHTVSDKHREEE